MRCKRRSLQRFDSGFRIFPIVPSPSKKLKIVCQRKWAGSYSPPIFGNKFVLFWFAKRELNPSWLALASQPTSQPAYSQDGSAVSVHVREYAVKGMGRAWLDLRMLSLNRSSLYFPLSLFACKLSGAIPRFISASPWECKLRFLITCFSQATKQVLWPIANDVTLLGACYHSD